MRISKICQQYCIGCGLCQSELSLPLQEDEKGFWKPSFGTINHYAEVFLQKVCPVIGKNASSFIVENVWGKEEWIFEGHATDVNLRKKASSGGVISALATFLLSSGKVDAILEISAKAGVPTETICRVCTTEEEIMDCCGSRYSISSPWKNLSSVVEKQKKYAAVGKPCDIAALRNLKNAFGKYDNVLFLLSFFCAGMPSRDANLALLRQMGCMPNHCVSLTYRGNGWPGETVAVDNEGQKHMLDYGTAWGGILGRDVHPFCRICMDGIGGAADIACGDGWYLTSEGSVDFSEHEGRNVICVRTDTGKKLFDEAVNNVVIEAQIWPKEIPLQQIQNYQYIRRTTMKSRLLAYRLSGKKTPRYSHEILRAFSKKATIKQKGKIFIGTYKRILQKKI